MKMENENTDLQIKSFEMIEGLTETFKDKIRNVFDKYKINAEVSVQNVSNSILAFSKNPNFVKDFSESINISDIQNYDGTENNFGAGIIGMAKNALSFRKNKKEVESVTESKTESEKEKKSKTSKILGINPYLFYALLTIIILTIIVIIVKIKK